MSARAAHEKSDAERLRLTFPSLAYVNPAPPTSCGTATSTVEALMFGLRRGMSCLEEPGNHDRLRRCDATAMKQITARLLGRGWPEDEIAKLVAAWHAVRGGP
jgi:hypothetical protein